MKHHAPLAFLIPTLQTTEMRNPALLNHQHLSCIRAPTDTSSADGQRTVFLEIVHSVAAWPVFPKMVL
jgi:hypothetical protein